jgi:Oxidoreductase family, NAD-binding Rossmann fold/Oxidoreductase family, C-terminal alpha/beta domain
MAGTQEAGGPGSRRSFIRNVATTTAGMLIVPRHVLGRGFQAPSDRLNIAIVGHSVGGMGMHDMRALFIGGNNIVALCDVDETAAGAARLKALFEARPRPASATPLPGAWPPGEDLPERRPPDPGWEDTSAFVNSFPSSRRYHDFRVMLEKQKDIDAVVVSTPDHNHAVIAMAAMQLGKHVYVQKPMTRTISEARALTEAARRYKVVSQMGNQGHSSEGIRLIEEWIRDGAIGRVREVHCWTNRPIWAQGMPRPSQTPPVPEGLDWDLWIGPVQSRPYHRVYHPFSWRAWYDFGSGSLGDMGCHVMDAAYSVLKLGPPSSVLGFASKLVMQAPKPDGSVEETPVVYDDSFPPATIVHYTFPPRSEDLPAVKLTWYDGGLQPPRPDDLEPERRMLESGTIFVGEKGKLMCDEYAGSPRLIPETAMQAYTRPAKTIPRIRTSHQQAWADAIKGTIPPPDDFDAAGPFTETVLLGNLAPRFPGQRLEWDGPNMRITNLPEANEFVQHHYRKGWSLE